MNLSSDYKNDFKEMKDYFALSSMEEVCLKMGLKKYAYKSWVKNQRVTPKHWKIFIDIKNGVTSGVI